jgi:1-acyl-sn-glycerol-3-phosphate acyltransferase
MVTFPVKKRFSYMANKELFEKKIFAAIIRYFDAFPVDRGNDGMDVIKTSAEKIKAGRNLMIFPEGKRSKDGTVGRVKSGVIFIAAMTGADIVPVGIEFSGKLRFRTKIIIRYGKVIEGFKLQDGKEPSAREMKDFKNLLQATIKELAGDNSTKSESPQNTDKQE